MIHTSKNAVWATCRRKHEIMSLESLYLSCVI